MEQKFKTGDICKTKTSGQTVMVINYKVNYAGSIINYFNKNSNLPDEVVTEDVLCEFEIKGERKRQYFHEANLELITAA